MRDHVLVVENERPVRELCARVLAQAGYAVKSAVSADDAVAKLARARYDLVLCDLKLRGELTGPEFVGTVRRQFPGTSVISMTDHSAPEVEDSKFEPDAFDHVTKPFEVATLLGVVRQCLQARHLSQELGRERLLREELQSAYAQLQESDRQKEAFLARFNHEIRTPFILVLHYLALLEAGPGENPAEMHVHLKGLRGAIDNVWNLMGNLLLLSDLQRESAEAQHSRVNLRMLVHTIALHLKAEMDAKRLEIEFVVGDEPWILMGDGVLLRTALKHLFLNAINFNKRGGKIRVEVKDSAAGIVIRISDTGIGIAQDKLITIFNSFYQVAQYMTREVGGLGIGLTIVRRIIEAHGGTISVTSHVNEGSTFEILLPNSRRASAPAAQSGGMAMPSLAA